MQWILIKAAVTAVATLLLGSFATRPPSDVDPDPVPASGRVTWKFPVEGDNRQKMTFMGWPGHELYSR